MKLRFFAFLMVTAGLAFAHHGNTSYSTTEPYTVSGTVVEFQFLNPHCIVVLETKDGSGATQKWQGEFSNPGVLSRRGWNAASLEAGEKLTITGHPAWKGVLAIHVTRIVSASGALKLELRE